MPKNMPTMTLTKEDLGQIREVVRDEVRTYVDPLFQGILLDIKRLDRRIDELHVQLVDLRVQLVDLQKQVEALTNSVDRYLKRSEDWHQEFVILKAQHDRLHKQLVVKGIVSESELDIQE